MATKHGYARRGLGGGNTLKAVTRAGRSASGRSIGKAKPLKAEQPNWRAHKRRALQALRQVVDNVEEREEAA